ncbi:flavonol 3-O-glucosyltransferase-like [Punica granatum]|uniref:Flavonol 3-O-glucosyltransferase-like n=1 Tax=Punica granatum TaxID=22663 RepID=A0A6P8C215_PUNGR|nr:flavonol 3-O-glucosyltransferase-like [Punica granatum]
MMNPKSQVAVIPFSFSGHLLPLVNLVRRLAANAPDVIFSFFNTASSNKTLFYSSNNQAEPLPSNVKVYDIAATVTWEEETTKELKSQMVGALEPFLEVAVASFEDAINAAVKENGVRVSCLLIDGLMVFSCKIAEKLQAKWVAVWVPTLSILPAYIYRDLLVPLLKAVLIQ